MKRSRKGRSGAARQRPFVFLSHSGKDRWVALQLEIHLRQAGADVFLDAVSIDDGRPFEESIRPALKRMHEIVVLLTPWSLDRPYIWCELGIAWLRGIPIIGLLYGVSAEELQSMPEVPHFLKGTRLRELNDVDAYFHSVAMRTGKRPAL